MRYAEDYQPRFHPLSRLKTQVGYLKYHTQEFTGSSGQASCPEGGLPSLPPGAVSTLGLFLWLPLVGSVGGHLLPISSWPPGTVLPPLEGPSVLRRQSGYLKCEVGAIAWV